MTETTSASTAVIEADVREGTYGAKVATIEPGGAEYIPLSERHGKPLQQFWTWVSPNMEFATIFVGIIGVWFFGHNLVHAFERWAFPVLVVIFAIAAGVIFSKAHYGAHISPIPGGTLGGWLITLGAAFGYAAGWNPYASDYTRYLPKNTNRKAAGLWAGLGVFVSCLVLEIVGAAAATITDVARYSANPTAGFVSNMPTWVGDITLLAIALGAVCANALNVYSGSMSFLALGFKLPLTLRRAIVAIVFGVAGFFVALSGLSDAGTKYNNFLLVIAYWIGPWLGVFFTDQFLRRGKNVAGFLFDRRHNPWAGVAAMAISMGVSIWLFANQTDYVGVLPKHHPAFGDLTFEVGFVLAALLYALFYRLQPTRAKEEGLYIPGEAEAVTA